MMRILLGLFDPGPLGRSESPRLSNCVIAEKAPITRAHCPAGEVDQQAHVGGQRLADQRRHRRSGSKLNRGRFLPVWTVGWVKTQNSREKGRGKSLAPTRNC